MDRPAGNDRAFNQDMVFNQARFESNPPRCVQILLSPERGAHVLNPITPGVCKSFSLPSAARIGT